PSKPIVGNPFSWLASRDGSTTVARRVLPLLVPIWIVFLLLLIFSSKPEPAFVVAVFTAYAMHLVLKITMALEASRRMSEDRQSGALELLLVTPLGVRAILNGHRDAIKNLFRRPIATLRLVNLAMITTVVLCKRLQMDGD